MRENAEDKGRRILGEGRVIVEAAAPGYFAAMVRGNGEVYRVEFGRGGWRCSCEAKGRCSHLVACWLIAAPTARPVAS